MKYRSEKTADNEKGLNAPGCTPGDGKGFSLVEVLTALIILAFISSSTLVVINRCMDSTAESALHMQAFEVARENMERLLSSDAVTETIEYGSSEKYPAIQWETRVELFSEPVNSTTWVKGVCLADYIDVAGEKQTVELTHWLTDLTDEQVLKINEAKEKKEQLLAEQIIETSEDAADYADVDEETVQRWVDNGMMETDQGYYLKCELDLYKLTDGKPTAEQKNQLRKGYADLFEAVKQRLDKSSGRVSEADRDRDSVGDKDRPLSERDPKKMTTEERMEFIREFFKQFQK